MKKRLNNNNHNQGTNKKKPVLKTFSRKKLFQHARVITFVRIQSMSSNRSSSGRPIFDRKRFSLSDRFLEITDRL